MLVRLLASVGEKDTIVRYPDLIQALVAVGRDPVASTVNLAELRAGISPTGFRRSLLVRPDELRRLRAEAQLVVLPAGHVPYLGHPERVSELLSAFVRSAT